MKEFKENKITKTDFKKLKEDNVLFITNPGRMGDLDGSYFVYSPQQFSKFAISIDYGTINPCSAGLWGLNGVCWYRIREYYFDSRIEGYQRTDEEHLDEILKSLVDGKHITACVVDPSAASFAETLKRHGFYVVFAENKLRRKKGYPFFI